VSIVLHGRDGLMCPNASNQPIHPAHQLHNGILDAIYEVLQRHQDTQGELPESLRPLDDAYTAASAGPSVTDYMSLFCDDSRHVYHGGRWQVSTWWWKCSICGLILPATATQAQP
jgi:hypothetical protein